MFYFFMFFFCDKSKNVNKLVFLCKTIHQQDFYQLNFFRFFNYYHFYSEHLNISVTSYPIYLNNQKKKSKFAKNVKLFVFDYYSWKIINV